MIQPITNSLHSTDYAHLVGKFVANFGAIEALTYMWIGALSEGDLLVELSASWQLKDRLDLVQKLIARSACGEEWKARSTALWREAKDLSDIRNIVCHSPVLLFWGSAPPNGVPDRLMSAQLRNILRGRGVRMIEVPELISVVDQSAGLATKLFHEKALIHAKPETRA